MRSKNKILKDLRILYQQALTHKDLSTALKVIELNAKMEGLFTSPKSKHFSLKDLSDTDLERMIQELKEE